jgi:hypothetical protein
MAAASLPSEYYSKSIAEQIAKGTLVDKEGIATLHDVLKSIHIIDRDGWHQLTKDCPVGATCISHTYHSYTQSRKYIFGLLHLDEESDGYSVEGVYCRRRWHTKSFPPGKGPRPGEIPYHKILNTEHTWPQSHFSTEFPKSLQKSDLHALFPVESSVNSSRNNLPFGEVVKTQSSLCPLIKRGRSQSGRIVFEPANIHKGNAARAIFYFAVRYKMSIDEEQEEVLKRWHLEDPVDDSELERHEEIYELQYTRNPFIDFPELVTLISDF